MAIGIGAADRVERFLAAHPMRAAGGVRGVGERGWDLGLGVSPALPRICDVSS